MADCIYFESFIHSTPNHVRRIYATENGNEWLIEEKWSENLMNMVQEITIKKKTYFESYVDLEVFYASNKSDKIFKSGRMCSTNIYFKFDENEYSHFVEGIGGTPGNLSRKQLYYKVTLTPIFQFFTESCSKPGKRTIIDQLKGLKKLSQDIGSLKDYNINEKQYLTSSRPEQADHYSDVIICCGEKQIKAHRNILTVRSALFHKLFCNIIEGKVYVYNHSENVQVETYPGDNSNIKAKIMLKDISPSILHELIDFIYTGQYKTFSIQKAKNLLIAAGNYGIYDLQEKCEGCLTTKICKETRKELYDLASVRNLKELQNSVLDHVQKRILGIREKKKRKRRERRVEEEYEENEEQENRMDNSAQSEDEMDDEEKRRWMVIMEQHPVYLKSIREAEENVHAIHVECFKDSIFIGGSERVQMEDRINMNRMHNIDPYFDVDEA